MQWEVNTGQVYDLIVLWPKQIPQELFDAMMGLSLRGGDHAIADRSEYWFDQTFGQKTYEAIRALHDSEIAEGFWQAGDKGIGMRFCLVSPHDQQELTSILEAFEKISRITVSIRPALPRYYKHLPVD